MSASLCEAWTGHGDGEGNPVACGQPGRSYATTGGLVTLCDEHAPDPIAEIMRRQNVTERQAIHIHQSTLSFERMRRHRPTSDGLPREDERGW